MRRIRRPKTSQRTRKDANKRWEDEDEEASRKRKRPMALKRRARMNRWGVVGNAKGGEGGRN